MGGCQAVIPTISVAKGGVPIDILDGAFGQRMGVVERTNRGEFLKELKSLAINQHHELKEHESFGEIHVVGDSRQGAQLLKIPKAILESFRLRDSFQKSQVSLSSDAVDRHADHRLDEGDALPNEPSEAMTC